MAVLYRGIVLGFALGTIYPLGKHVQFRKSAKEAGLGGYLRDYSEAEFATRFPGVSSPFRAFTAEGEYNTAIGQWLMWGDYAPASQPKSPAEMREILREAKEEQRCA